MAGSSLLALIDDIATVLDDVALMTKVAAKKTAGVLGDDLALNAEQVSGVRASREIPVVWAVAKGSFKNKLILVPAALLISAFIPWLISPLLMVGGLYLCYEGYEKVSHKFFHKEDVKQEQEAVVKAIRTPDVDMKAFEQRKIKGAIRTDFILSAEIIVIALGTVSEAKFGLQVAVVAGIAMLMTVGVYGLVAGIVKLDDAGYYLIKNELDTLFGKFSRLMGNGLLAFAPFLMKALAFVGTLAMFMVGGGILTHGISIIHHWIAATSESLASISLIGPFLTMITPVILNLVFGVICGALTLGVVTMALKLKPKT